MHHPSGVISEFITVEIRDPVLGVFWVFPLVTYLHFRAEKETSVFSSPLVTYALELCMTCIHEQPPIHVYTRSASFTTHLLIHRLATLKAFHFSFRLCSWNCVRNSPRSAAKESEIFITPLLSYMTPKRYYPGDIGLGAVNKIYKLHHIDISTTYFLKSIFKGE